MHITLLFLLFRPSFVPQSGNEQVKPEQRQSPHHLSNPPGLAHSLRRPYALLLQSFSSLPASWLFFLYPSILTFWVHFYASIDPTRFTQEEGFSGKYSQTLQWLWSVNIAQYQTHRQYADMYEWAWPHAVTKKADFPRGGKARTSPKWGGRNKLLASHHLENQVYSSSHSD